MKVNGCVEIVNEARKCTCNLPFISGRIQMHWDNNVRVKK